MSSSEIMVVLSTEIIVEPEEVELEHPASTNATTAQVKAVLFNRVFMMLSLMKPAISSFQDLGRMKP